LSGVSRITGGTEPFGLRPGRPFGLGVSAPEVTPTPFDVSFMPVSSI
jgi:hypothetical protein